MLERGDVIYNYDGSFDGFLCCVFHSFTRKEQPADICSLRNVQPSLLPAFYVNTDETHARRVEASVPAKIGKDALALLQHVFLSCLPRKELHMLDFMRLGYRHGPQVMKMLTNDTVNLLKKTELQTTHEAHLYSGFVRFSVHEGLLVASIKPKSCVLPLLGPHFAERFPNERFLIYDETHRMVCAYAGGYFYTAGDVDMVMPAPDADELAYRRLWRMFYDTVTVEGRGNNTCRRTLMPKRYWDRMTEFRRGMDALNVAEVDQRLAGLRIPTENPALLTVDKVTKETG